MKTNLAKALYKNKNCLGYIIPFTDGKYTYQNDNDLGLDLDALDYETETKKIYLYKRFYAYLICEDDIEDDGTGIELEMVKLLLKECHKHFIPLSDDEQKRCEQHWKGYF